MTQSAHSLVDLERLLAKMAADRSTLMRSLEDEAQRTQASRTKVVEAVRSSRTPVLFGLGATLVAAMTRKKRPAKPGSAAQK